MQFQNPWGALALVLLVPLILLYLLKQRHQEVKVPSTFLWDKVLAQWEATHPWQRWRKNLLFFLQLFTICLLALALMRPVWRTSGAGQNNIIILDVSMSMQAEEGGRTRIDRAKEEVQLLVDGMQRHEEASLILSGAQNELLISKSQDKDSLLQLLGEVEGHYTGSKLEDALRMAEAIAGPDNQETIHLFTDRDIAVYGEHILLHNVALGAENVALTNISYSRSSGDGSLNILGLLYNFGQAKTVHVELWADGVLMDVRACSLEDDSPGNIMFERLDASLQQIKLNISEQDALMADNQAFLAVQDNETYKVLLQTQRNVFLEKAILLREDIELYKTPPSEELPQETYSLLIGDGWPSETLPENQNIWMIAPQQDTTWFGLTQGAQGDIQISSTELGDSLLRYVDLSGLRVAESNSFSVQDASTTVLAYIDQEPLMILQEQDGVKRFALGFDLHDSNLPLQKDFPILVQNILEWFLPRKEGQTGQTVAGNSMLIAMQTDAAYYDVRLPDGSVLAERKGLQFEQTQQLGFYTVTQYNAYGEEIGTSGFAVNASVLEESELRTATTESQGNVRQAAEIWRRWNLWPYLILCALVIMALEWWVYHRGA